MAEAASSTTEWASAPWRASPAVSALTAVFAVDFHVKQGNRIVFQHPAEADLVGLEFKVCLKGGG